jgi:hypothetical protein
MVDSISLIGLYLASHCSCLMIASHTELDRVRTHRLSV